MQSNSLKTNTVRPKLILLIAAFAAVYIIWGSTYLAIKYAIETLPTFLMAGVRFGVAGAILYGWARISGNYERPTRMQWRTSFIIGALLLGIGNGGVVFAEHYLSSSVTALLIATTPFWIVVLGWAFMGTGRPNYKMVTGLAVGFIGVILLILGRSSSDGGIGSNGQWIGIVAILAAQLAWAAGSLYGARASATKSAIQAAGMQMLAGGAILLGIGTLVGEWSSFDPSKVSATSSFALGYLILFGAIVAFTAYSWLLKNASPAKVSTYAYVNPAIAVVLGWLIAGETMTGQMLLGAAVVVVSVALVTVNKKEKTDDKAAVEEIDRLHTPTPGRRALSVSTQKEF
jgi:drug/metabolite transporter (DMT)-like permease